MKRDDRVEPPAARVAADDVGGVADARAGLVRARRRKIGDMIRGAAGRVDAIDPGVLVDPVAAAEQIVGSTDEGGSGVVKRHRQCPSRPVPVRVGDADRVRRDVRRREACKQGDGSPGCGRRRGRCVLNRACQRSHPPRLHPQGRGTRTRGRRRSTARSDTGTCGGGRLRRSGRTDPAADIPDCTDRQQDRSRRRQRSQQPGRPAAPAPTSRASLRERQLRSVKGKRSPDASTAWSAR